MIVEPDGVPQYVEILHQHGYETSCCETLAAARATLLRRADIALVLVDLALSDDLGRQLLAELANAIDPPPAIVTTREPALATAVEAMRLAAIDYLVKPVEPEVLLARVEAALQKSRPGPATLCRNPAPCDYAVPVRTRRTPTPETLSRLSPREREVVELVVLAASVREIASALFISEHTVRNHLRAIYQKLGVHSRVELARRVLGGRGG